MERSKASQMLHHVLTGITRQCDPDEHAKRWGKPGKVAERVREYEEASLTSPTADAHRSVLPVSPRSAPSTPTRERAGRVDPGVNVVSASVFHDARARSASRGFAASPTHRNKENSAPLASPSRRAGPAARSTANDVSSSSSSSSSQVSYSSAEGGYTSSNGTSATSATNATSSQSAENAQVEVAQRIHSESPQIVNFRETTPRRPLPTPTATPRARAATVSESRPPRPAYETPEQQARRIDASFVQLLDSMQISSSEVRQRMMTLTVAMKEDMLRSSMRVGPTSTGQHARAQSLSASQSRPSSATSNDSNNLKRRTKSSASLSSMNTEAQLQPPKKSQRSRANSASSLFRSLGRSSASKEAKAVVVDVKERDVAEWLALLSRHTSKIDPKDVRVLRVRLRNESPAWIEQFVREGGYQMLLDRFGDLYKMEWREEQHDDQLLDGLLRCLVALTLTAVGKRALASQCPTPFIQLADLMFSEKRPGDLPCRQQIVEILLALFTIQPAGARAIARDEWPISTSSVDHPPTTGPKRYVRPAKGAEDESPSVEQQIQTHFMVHSLMRGPPNEKEEAKVDFIQHAHQQRPFKKWAREVASTANDYFWIFCHKNNAFWPLQLVDEKAIESPTVPTGMTGGVEYEAMQYCTKHLKLLNALVQSAPSMDAAFKLHHDLFMSGFERVLMSLRRASTTFYPLLHLEMARYIHLARSARFNLGPQILSHLDVRVLSQPERAIVEQYQAQLARQAGPSGAPQLSLDL